MKQIAELQEAAGISDSERDRLCLFTNRLVDRHREKIERIAEAVLKRKSGRLSGLAVDRLMMTRTAKEWRALRRKFLRQRARRAKQAGTDARNAAWRAQYAAGLAA